jgi:NADPH2:quinone reductase
MKQMKAIIQKEAGGPLSIESRNIPIPKKGEVLVKMSYAQINPSDLSFLDGHFNDKPSYPIIPGLEGSGLVIEAGGGFLAKMRKGKKVGLSKKNGLDGTWAEYAVTDASSVIPLGNIPLDTGAGLIVNPLTAAAFLDIIKKKNHHVVYNNAAGGDLGQLFMHLAKIQGFTLISEVRSASQVEVLKHMGAEHVLNSSSSSYPEELKQLLQDLKPSLILDAIGGEKSKLLIQHAPPNSTYMPYANLSEDDSVFDARSLLQNNISH